MWAHWKLLAIVPIDIVGQGGREGGIARQQEQRRQRVRERVDTEVT